MKKDTIERIVKATGVKPGELILLHFWGGDEQRGVLHDFEAAVAKLGAAPISLQQSRHANQSLFATAMPGCFGEKYFHVIDSADAVIDIFMHRLGLLERTLEEEQMELCGAYMQNLFGSLMNRDRFTQIRIPTIENAEDSDLNPEDFVERMEAALDIDYEEMRRECQSRMEQIGRKTGVKIHTGENCVLNLQFGDRSWLMDAGDGDLPCGEVYIAPEEKKSKGSIYFDKLYLDGGQTYDKITLQIQDGSVVSASDREAEQFFRELPPGGKVVCEFGIGMNPRVTELCGYAVLDEKMRDTFHIAVGMNTMFGGTNQAPLHLDLVGRGEIEWQD